jgi:flagellar hook-basal body complex protein FliE
MSIIGISGLPGKIQGNMPSNNEKNSKGDSSFNDILTKSLKEVNSAQIKSINALNSLVAGKTENIHETMIQMQKASISFQMMMEVRNKLVDAYNEIIKMRS